MMEYGPRMDMMARRWIFLMVFLLIGTWGCSTYQPLPINQKAVESFLAPPDLKRLEVEVLSIDHPILRPIKVDLNDGLSPDEAALIAVIANPRLRAIRDQRGIAIAQLIEAKLLPNPQLSAGLEIPTGGHTSGTVGAYAFQLDWDLKALITTASRVSAAKAKKAKVDLGIAWQEWQVAQAAKLHLLRLFWTEKKLTLLKKAERDFQKNLELVKEAVALGEKTALELTSAQTVYQNIRLDLSRLEQEREQERLALNKALGFPPGYSIPIQKDFIPSCPSTPIQDGKIPSNLLKNRLDLMALSMGYKSQEARLRAAVLSQFPRIGVGLLQARDTGDVKTCGLTVTLELPFFDQGQGRIALERASRKMLYDQYMARLFEARSQVVSIVKKMASLKERVLAEERAIGALENLLSIYNKAINQGNGDLLSYYQAQEQLIARRLALYELRQTLTDLGVALETATGTYLPVNTSHTKA